MTSTLDAPVTAAAALDLDRLGPAASCTASRFVARSRWRRGAALMFCASVRQRSGTRHPAWSLPGPVRALPNGAPRLIRRTVERTR